MWYSEPFYYSICKGNGEGHCSTLNQLFAENVCSLTEVKFNFDMIQFDGLIL